MTNTDRRPIDELIEYITDNCRAVDQEERFDAFLSVYDDELPDCLSGLTVAGILKEMRPVDYRCGLSDFMGTDDTLYAIGSEMYDLDDVEKARDEFIENIEAEIYELQQDAEKSEDEDCHSDEIEYRENMIAVVKRHVF